MRKIALCLIVLCTACRANRGSEDLILPEDWDRMSEKEPLCLGSPPFVATAGESTTWKLESPSASIRLPSDFREGKSDDGKSRVWSAPDSSRFSYEVSVFPYSAGLASDGGMKIEMEGRCSLPVAGHRAFTMRFRMDDTTRGTSHFVASSSVVLRKGQVLNAWIESPSPLKREQLLRAFSEMRVVR